MTRRAQIADLLRTRLFTGLHLGLLRHQGRLPSVRELARELDANPRVVLAAYRTLAQEGLVELRSRSGVFMAPAGRRNHATADGRSDWMVDVLVQGLTRGMSAPILAEGLQRCLETLRLHAVVVECNEDQLYSVPAELKRDFGLETTAIDVAALDQGGRPPALLRRADLLVTTPFHKTAVERLADSLGTPKIVITMCTDLFTEVGRLLSTMPVY
nr:GntR family transcriptional regulator [Gemmatimonadales bacterium]